MCLVVAYRGKTKRPKTFRGPPGTLSARPLHHSLPPTLPHPWQPTRRPQNLGETSPTTPAPGRQEKRTAPANSAWPDFLRNLSHLRLSSVLGMRTTQFLGGNRGKHRSTALWGHRGTSSPRPLYNSWPLTLIHPQDRPCRPPKLVEHIPQPLDGLARKNGPHQRIPRGRFAQKQVSPQTFLVPGHANFNMWGGTVLSFGWHSQLTLGE